MIDELREICAEGRAGARTLEELIAPLQKIVDEMRAGDGPLEALKQSILDRRKITGEGTMALQEYVVCARGSTGTPKGRRDGIPSMFDGGNGADSAAEEKPVARWRIDPGGAANTYMYAGEGKILYPEITGTSRRKNPGEGQGAPLVRQLEENTMHKFEEEKSKTLEEEEISTMRCLEKYMRYRKLRIVGV